MLLLNDTPISFFNFSAGEMQVKLPEKLESERAHLKWKPTSSDDILKLMLTVNALHHAGVHDIDLDVLYLPYGRQDRVCAKGEAFSFEVICNILNNLKVSVIRFWDLHNESKTLDLLESDAIIIMELHDIFDRYKILDNFNLNHLVLCAPDQGAADKVTHLSNYYGVDFPVYFTKCRDNATGKITSLDCSRFNGDIGGEDILVVDDICDGGATFIEVAKILQTYEPKTLSLYVTHGIFSKGLQELAKYYSHIYCHHILHNGVFHSGDFLTIYQEFPHGS